MKGPRFPVLRRGTHLHVAGAPASVPTAGTRLAAWLARADAAAVRWSARPGRALLLLLAINLGLSAVAIPVGLAVNDDPAGFFRELMPGTWLSGAELGAAAVAAWAVHVRVDDVRWHHSFWGLSACCFGVLAVVEMTQPTVFLGKWLHGSLGAVAPFGFKDVDAALLVLLLCVVAATLGRRALVLLRHPRTALLLGCAGALGVASQALDSFVPVSAWEFVAEESLKLAGEPFLVAAFLVALGTVSGRRGSSPTGVRPK